jgi:hypothetical protein
MTDELLNGSGWWRWFILRWLEDYERWLRQLQNQISLCRLWELLAYMEKECLRPERAVDKFLPNVRYPFDLELFSDDVSALLRHPDQILPLTALRCIRTQFVI